MYYNRELSDEEISYIGRAQQKIMELSAAFARELENNAVDDEKPQLILELEYSIKVLRSTDLAWSADDIRMMMDYYTILCGLQVFGLGTFNFDYPYMGVSNSEGVSQAQLNALEESIRQDIEDSIIERTSEIPINDGEGSSSTQGGEADDEYVNLNRDQLIKSLKTFKNSIRLDGSDDDLVSIISNNGARIISYDTQDNILYLHDEDIEFASDVLRLPRSTISFIKAGEKNVVTMEVLTDGLSKYVTLDTVQSITGQKTFKSMQLFDNDLQVRDTPNFRFATLKPDQILFSREGKTLIVGTQSLTANVTQLFQSKGGIIALLDDVLVKLVQNGLSLEDGVLELGGLLTKDTSLATEVVGTGVLIEESNSDRINYGDLRPQPTEDLHFKAVIKIGDEVENNTIFLARYSQNVDFDQKGLLIQYHSNLLMFGWSSSLLWQVDIALQPNTEYDIELKWSKATLDWTLCVINEVEQTITELIVYGAIEAIDYDLFPSMPFLSTGSYNTPEDVRASFGIGSLFIETDSFTRDFKMEEGGGSTLTDINGFTATIEADSAITGWGEIGSAVGDLILFNKTDGIVELPNTTFEKINNGSKKTVPTKEWVQEQTPDNDDYVDLTTDQLNIGGFKQFIEGIQALNARISSYDSSTSRASSLDNGDIKFTDNSVGFKSVYLKAPDEFLGSSVTFELPKKSTGIHTLALENDEELLTAGENLTKGDLCYINTDGKVYKTIATDIDRVKGILVISLFTVNTDVEARMLLKGTFETTGLVLGNEYFIDETDGGITNDRSSFSEGSYSRSIGYAISTTELKFNPDNTYIGL